MAFYVVRNPDTDSDVWLAWEDTAQVWIYVYSPNLGVFVRSDPVAHDFYWDMEMQYLPVDVEEAARIVAAGQVGNLMPRSDGRRASSIDSAPAMTVSRRPSWWACPGVEQSMNS